MRAIRYEGPESGVRVASAAPDPACAEGEAIVRPLRIAIGPADIAFDRLRPKLPAITLGREFVGVIERLDAPKPVRSKEPSLIGRRVVASVDYACGVCDLCQRGLAHHCRNRKILGVFGREGCFADRLALPVRSLHPVPNEVDDDRAVFVEPLAAAAQCVHQLRVEGKPYITVLGDGVVALLCAQLMNRLNASVRVVGMNEHRLELAGKWGIKHRHEREVGRRADQDVVIDCTGKPEGFALALRLVRPRGKVLLKGPIHPALGAPWAIDFSPAVVNEVDVIGSRCGSIPEALELLRTSAVDVVSLISKRARLDDALDALKAAARPEHLKVLLDP